MASSQQLSIALPTGALGLGIKKHEITGLCFVYSKSNAASPLQVQDVIFSLNGIKLAPVEGGVDAWVKLFLGFASGPRNVVVCRRGAALPAAADVNGVPLPAKASCDATSIVHNDVSRPFTSLTTAADIAHKNTESSAMPPSRTTMCGSGGAYKAGIITAITHLNDRTGSSIQGIKKQMQANIPGDKKWLNGMFLNALKRMVLKGDLVQIKSSYKLSADFKAKVKESNKKTNTNVGIASNSVQQQPARCAARVSLSPVPTTAYAPETRVSNTAVNAPSLNMFTTAAANATTTAASKHPPKRISNATNSRSSAKVTVLVTKPSKESALGLNIQQVGNGAVKIISIASQSLFIGTTLKVGMVLETINGQECTTVEGAVALFKAVEGPMRIVAATVPNIVPTSPLVVMDSATFLPMGDLERRMAAARAAAGYTLPSIVP